MSGPKQSRGGQYGGAAAAVRLKKITTSGGNDYWEEPKYGIRFSDDLYNKLGEERTKEMAKSVTDVLDEFGVPKHDAHKIIHHVGIGNLGKGVFAQYAFNGRNGQIDVAEHYFKDENKLQKSYDACVKSGFHPKGTTSDDIVSHETGHAIGLFLEQTLANAHPINVFDYMLKRKGEKDVVSQAVRNVKKTQYGKGKRSVALKNALSGYSNSKPVECFAEAIADYRRNGKKANPLSVEIVSLIKQNLK